MTNQQKKANTKLDKPGTRRDSKVKHDTNSRYARNIGKIGLQCIYGTKKKQVVKCTRPTPVHTEARDRLEHRRQSIKQIVGTNYALEGSNHGKCGTTRTSKRVESISTTPDKT